MPDPKIIGKISNTLEEIRDILTGNKSSKLHNSLETISNTNVVMVELMKELVDTSRESNRIALTSSVSNKLNGEKSLKKVTKTVGGIKDILEDMAKDIKGIYKKSGLNLSEKDSKKILENIIKENNKKSKNSKLLGMIEVVSKLSSIKLKDFMLANIKIKAVAKIYDRLIKTFSKFKRKKEIEKVNEFALGAIEIVKKVSKIKRLGKSAQKGVEVINKVFFGRHGLIETMVKMNKHKRELKKTRKIVDDLYILTGKLVVVALLMTGLAVLGVTAMAGVVMAAGMIAVFGLVFGFIGLFSTPIKKGNTVVLGMMASLIIAGVGLYLLNKGTKDIKWEQLYKAGAVILGFGVITAILGIPIVFASVALGCVALGLLGAAIMSIGAGVAVFGALVTEKSIDKIAYGIPKILEAMTSIFGDEKGGNVSFGSTILGLISGCLKLGGAVFAAGALLLISISLGITGLCLRSWENFNIKAIDNVEYAISKLDNVLGLGLKNNRHSENGFFGQIMGVGSDILGFASTMIQSGKAFVGIGTVLFAGVVLGIIKGCIDKWKDFDKTSLDNIETSLTKLDNLLDLGLTRKTDDSVGGVLTAGLRLGSNMLELGSALFKAGGVLMNLGVLSIAMGVLDNVVESIKKWKGFDTSSIDTVLGVVTKISNYFHLGLGEEKPKGFLASVGDTLSKGFDVITGPLTMGSALINAGEQMAYLGVFSTAIGVIDFMIDSMIKAGKHAKIMKGSLDSVFEAFDKMIEYFFNDDRLDKSMWDNISGDGLLAGPIGMLGASLLSSDDRKTKLSILTTSVGIVDKMSDVIIKMGSYSGDVSNALDLTFTALDKLVDYMFGSPDKTGANALGRIGQAMATEHANGGFWESMFGDGSSTINTQIEVLTSCVGVVETMSNALLNMNKIAPDVDKSIDNCFYALEKISEYFFDDVDSNTSGALSKVANAMKKAHNSGGFWESMFGDGSSSINTQLEIIVGCVGVVGQVSEILTSMKDTKDINQSIKNITTSLDSIINYFSRYDEDKLDNIEDIADEFPDIFEHLEDSVSVFKDMESSILNLNKFADEGMPSIGKIIGGVKLYKEEDLENTSKLARKMPELFKNISFSLDYMKGEYEESINNIKILSENIKNITTGGGIDDMYNVGNVFEKITTSLVKYSNFTNMEKIDKLNTLTDKFNLFAKSSTPIIFDPITKVIDKVNSIDIEKATSLTNTFKSFTEINTFGGFFFNFKKQVALFTDACVRLVEAINGNTDALTTENIMDESENVTPEPSKKSIAISNVQELAEVIAESISRNSFGGGVFGDGLAVDLRINGEGGDSWVIRKY